MRIYHCFECGRLTEHLNVLRAAKRAAVSRATLYRWIHRALVHSIVHPSGRTLVCADSLLTPGFLRFPGTRAAAVPWHVTGGSADLPTPQLSELAAVATAASGARRGAGPSPIVETGSPASSFLRVEPAGPAVVPAALLARRA